MRQRLLICSLSVFSAGIFIVLLIGRLPGRSRIENLYVESAQLVKPIVTDESTYLGSPSCYHALSGVHRLESGHNIVIARRKMVDPRYFTYDDETYEFLSISLPTAMVGEKIRIPSQSVEIAFSHGGLAWFRQCAGDVGVRFQGSMVTKWASVDKLTVSLDISAIAASTHIGYMKQPWYIGVQFVAKRATLSQAQASVPEKFLRIEESNKRQLKGDS